MGRANTAPALAKLQAECDVFNALVSVGADVVVKLDGGERRATKTRSEAQVLSGHSAVVWLDGISGCYLLDRVTPSTKREYACSPERFQADVARHEMTILRDDGEAGRHIRFKRPDSGAYYFDLITFPGGLLIDGDCGSFVFKRTPDMFKFFRADDGRPGEINPPYWAEKVTAACDDGIKKFEWDTFERDVRDYLMQDAEGRDDAVLSARITREALDELAHIEKGEHGAVGFIRDFKCEKFYFCDWERSSTEFTFRYIWNLRAIVWGIAKYDALKAAGRDAANDDGSERAAA